MLCCLFIICFSSLTRVSSSFHHCFIIFIIFFIIFLLSLFTVIIFICRYHLFVIFIILHSSPYHLFGHLYHPSLLSLSSVLSSLPPTLFVLSFCHLVCPPILFSSSSLSSFLLVIFAVAINFHQPDKIMAVFYILSDLACSFIFFIVI